MVFSVFCNFARSQEGGKCKKKQYITLRHRYMANNETRDRIVESAIELFNRNGCKGVTMDDIAGSIHISKRTLYEVFANKNELVLACLKQVHCEIGQVRLEMFQKTDEPFLMTLYIMRTAALTNVRYSLNLIYKRDDLLRISNREEGGAHIELLIPSKEVEDETLSM